MKIMFHCDWNSSSEDLLNTYKIQTPNEGGVWNNIQATTNINQADYHVVMDGGKPQGVPWNRVIYLQREEPEIKATRLDFPDDLFFRGTYTDKNHYLVSVWRVIKAYDYLKSLQYDAGKKLYALSTITSGKSFASGHKKRIGFLEQLVNVDKQIHIFGNAGIEQHGNIKDCFKGELNYNRYCKFNGLWPYHYSLAFENSSIDNCVSEKAYDALLAWSMPIYWGCTNVSEYLPAGSYHHVDIDDPSSIQRVINIIKEPPTQDNINAMSQARKLILDSYNIWPEIETIINEKSND